MASTFLVEQKSFITLLSSMQPICTKRTSLDATASILFHVGHKELVLKSTDLEISLQASYHVKESDLHEPLNFLVSGRRIFELIKELDCDIQCSCDGEQLRLKAGKVHLSLHIKDAQEFPPFPERIENLMQIDASFLLEMLHKVAFVIPQNNTNPALNGLYVEIDEKELKMTSTDGHCLAQARSSAYTLHEPKQWLLPRRAIFELKKLLETTTDATIFLGVCGNQLVFSGESFNFFTKLLVDPFPQYQAILDRKEFKGATIGRSPLVKTLRRSSCLLSGQFIATTFNFNADQLNVSMQNNEVGKLEEELPIQGFDGQTMDVRFYAPYLLSGLQVFSDDTLTFYLKNSSKPIMFETSTENMHLLYLVMPVAPTSG